MGTCTTCRIIRGQPLDHRTNRPNDALTVRSTDVSMTMRRVGRASCVVIPTTAMIPVAERAITTAAPLTNAGSHSVAMRGPCDAAWVATSCAPASSSGARPGSRAGIDPEDNLGVKHLDQRIEIAGPQETCSTRSPTTTLTHQSMLPRPEACLASTCSACRSRRSRPLWTSHRAPPQLASRARRRVRGATAAADPDLAGPAPAGRCLPRGVARRDPSRPTSVTASFRSGRVLIDPRRGTSYGRCRRAHRGVPAGTGRPGSAPGWPGRRRSRRRADRRASPSRPSRDLVQNSPVRGR